MSLIKSIIIRHPVRALSLSHFPEGEKSRRGEKVLDNSILMSIILNMNIASNSASFPKISHSPALASTYFLPMWQPCYTSFRAISLGGPERRGVGRSDRLDPLGVSTVGFIVGEKSQAEKAVGMLRSRPCHVAFRDPMYALGRRS